MGIKHKAVKQSGERGYATEWNDDHVIDGDVDFKKYKIINLVVDSGNIFPTGPTAGQLFYRDDLGMLYVFDGTDWRTVLYFTGRHTDLLNKEVNGIIDHADNSITTSKLRDGAVTEAKVADNSISTNKIKDGAVTVAKTSNHHKCRVFLSAGGHYVEQHQTWVFTWDAEDYDESNMFDKSISNTRIYIKESGYYLINLSFNAWAETGDQLEFLFGIKLNGNYLLTGKEQSFSTEAGPPEESVSLTAVKYLNVGDYLEVWITNELLNEIGIDSETDTTYFEVIRLF
jgi:hypothetical protein